MPRFRVAAYNAAYYKAADRKDLVKLFDEADLVGFQEMSRKADLKHLRSFPEFATFTGRNRGVSVAWRKSEFKLLKSGSHKLSNATKISRGAGPDNQPAKYLTWVKLRHKKSGRVIWFGSCHLTPSLYVPARYKVHDTQTDNLVKWARGKANPIIVGDFNIDAKKDERQRDPNMPFVKFEKVNMFSTYRTLPYPKGGTHGKRLIDYIFYKPKVRLKAINHKIITGLSSDHNALVATFNVTLTLRKRLSRKK